MVDDVETTALRIPRQATGAAEAPTAVLPVGHGHRGWWRWNRRDRLGRVRAVAGVAALSGLGVFAGVVNAGVLDGLPLLNPALATAVEISAGLALVGSWIIVQRRWLVRTVPILVGSATAVTALVALGLWLTGTVTDAYPPWFGVWVAMALAAAAGLPLVLRRPGVLRRSAALLAVPLTIAGAVLFVDDEYGVWPHLGDLLGHGHELSGADLQRILHLPPGSVRPDKGVLADLDVPATVSHFAHRPGSVYLPPAYFGAARRSLPVIVMLAGVPGSTTQWIRAGQAVATADGYANTHHGAVAIMIFVDQNGSATGDTECVDGPRGDAETFLTTDVKNFITDTLHVPHNASRRAVVGFSEGGTCALDLGLMHPDLYRHFADLGGDARPTLGDSEHTLANLFGGSASARDAHDAAKLLATHHYSGVTAWFASGEDDRPKLPIQHRLALAAGKAGITVHEFTDAGGHNWQFVSRAFVQILPPLCADMGVH